MGAMCACGHAAVDHDDDLMSGTGCKLDLCACVEYRRDDRSSARNNKKSPGELAKEIASYLQSEGQVTAYDQMFTFFHTSLTGEEFRNPVAQKIYFEICVQRERLKGVR